MSDLAACNCVAVVRDVVTTGVVMFSMCSSMT